jgi:GT2 family glycosyltransferase
MKKHVTVIIPTYNGISLLKKHLPDVESILHNGDELLIVDDASTDDSVAWLTKRYSVVATTDSKVFQGSFFRGSEAYPVLIIVNPTNQRFARSINSAVRLVSTSLFLLLNNDVKPEKDVLSKLTPCFNDRSVFAVGCHEYESTDRELEGGKNLLWFQRGVFQHARAQEFSSGETAWVSGGSGMFDTEKWLQLGGFDESFYPAYWEDTDVSFRARKQGWKILFCAEAVVHHQHETSNVAAFGRANIRQLSWQHQQYFTRKHASFWQLIQYYVWQPYWWWKLAQ